MNRNRKAKYYYCATLRDLVSVLCDRVRDFDLERIKEFGEVTFVVEDTPEPREGREMSQEALAKAYSDASGAYGVSTLNLFSQHDTAVAVGYYGGHGMQVFTVQADCGVDRYVELLTRQMTSAVFSAMLANCDENRMKNFIVEVRG